MRASTVRTTSVGYLINQAARRMDQTMSSALEPMGVSIDQFKIVMTLTEFEGISQSELGKRTGLASYSVTRLLDDLAAQKLIVRRPSRESRRSFSIYLTAKGKELSPQLFKIVSEVNQSVLSSLTKSESEKLREILTKLIFNNE